MMRIIENILYINIWKIEPNRIYVVAEMHRFQMGKMRAKTLQWTPEYFIRCI